MSTALLYRVACVASVIVIATAPAAQHATPATPAAPPDLRAWNDGRAPASAPIPFDAIADTAAGQYVGDGLSVVATGDGARVRSVFQELDGEARPDGLWITSTADEAPGRLRLVARAVGRGDAVDLPATGAVAVGDNRVRFSRPLVTEEYTTSVAGVQQDFVLLKRPSGAGDVRLHLALTGARADSAAAGARLTLNESGRALVYSQLHVEDATGRALVASIEVVDVGHLLVRVDDAGAAYPVRIDPTFSDADWVSLSPGIPGADGQIQAVVADDLGNIYVGGTFAVVGNVAASRVAKWDGTSWSALGTGANATVFALAVSGSYLYAGGDFTTAGGEAANRVARWDGSAWSPLGTGMNGSVRALAVSGSDVYAGGQFTTAGDVAANRIARWNGGGWSALGTGFASTVYALAISGTNLYAGGSFLTTGDGVLVNRIAAWDGSTWSALGVGANVGVNADVYALAVSGTSVYVGGFFSGAGGAPISRIARWDGSAWAPVGSGLNGAVRALAFSGSNLYAAGDFNAAGVVTANRVAMWDGSAWSAVGTGTNSLVYGLAVSGTDVYVGGFFTSAGGAAASRLAKWDGSGWSALGTGMNDNVQAVAVSGTNLYVGGAFTSVGTVMANRVARWDGSTWSALGTGMNGTVSALAVSGTTLYAGGFFTTADDATARFIAKWDGVAWSPLDTGVNGSVRALAVIGSDLYAGGLFTAAGAGMAMHVAKWDGVAWSPLGLGSANGTNNSAVYALAATGTDLYVGGDFTMAGGYPAVLVAKWNGSAWSSLPTGPVSVVTALAATGTEVYAAGGAKVHKWDGSAWSLLGTMNATVNALAVDGTAVYAGGDFTAAAGTPANHIAKWNGSAWSALGTGLNATVSALAADASGHLLVGGSFSLAGSTVSPFIVQANIGNHAPVANAGPDQHVDATSASGAEVQLDGSASTDPDAPSGDSIVLYEWLDGSGPVGTGASLTLTVPFGVHTYTLKVTDTFGAIATDTVVITVADRFTIAIATPPAVAASYDFGEVVPAVFTCADTANLLLSCVGAPLVGGNLDTSVAGARLLTVTATNTRGEWASASREYTVRPPARLPLKQITFEGGLTDAVTGVDRLSGSVQLETATPLDGAQSATIKSSSGYLEERFAATDDFFLAVSLRVNALPSASPRILFISTDGATRGNLLLTSDGRLRLRIDSTTIGESAPLVPGQVYRVGMHQRKGSGGDAVLEAFLASGDEAFGAPFAALGDGTWTLAADRIRVGATNSNAVNITVDDIYLDGAAMPGPTP